MMQTLRVLHETPEHIVDAVRRRLGDQLVAVVLFGSRARGESREDSDWDLLLIAEGLPQGELERMQVLRQALSECRGVTVLLKTPAEFERYLLPLYLDVALDGKILYDPRGYAAARLEAVRRLIQRAGLRRERTEAGDVWRWKREPSRPWALQLGGWRMEGTQGARYRLYLAELHLGAAQRLVGLEMWPTCVDNCQVVAENAAKAVLALLAPLGRTHDPGVQLHKALRESRFPEALRERVERLAQCAERLGSDVHTKVTYGDEERYITPWELFREPEGRTYLELAEEAFRLAREITAELGLPPTP